MSKSEGGEAGRGGSRRARDMPDPRKADSLSAPLLRRLFAWPYRVVLAALYRMGLRGVHLTVLSLATNVAVGGLLFGGRHVLAGFTLLAGGLLDIFDGALARLRGEASRGGALLDSTVDRASDAIVFGSLFLSEAGRGEELAGALALAALLVSLLVSHVRAQAEAVGTQMSEGWFQRTERVAVLVTGLVIPGALEVALAILAGMGALTVGQRLVTAWRRLARP